MTNSATNERLLLDCETCRHRFLIRRSVAHMVTTCPKCKQFVVPCEREVPPLTWIGPSAQAPTPRQQPATISPPPLPRVVSSVSPAHLSPAPVGLGPPRLAQPSPDSFAVLGRFMGGVVLGFSAVVGFLLLLPILIWVFCVGAFFVVLLSIFAACFGRTN